MAVDGDGVLYIAQSGPVNRIRKVDQNGIISTVAGSGRQASAAMVALRRVPVSMAPWLSR